MSMKKQSVVQTPSHAISTKTSSGLPEEKCPTCGGDVERVGAQGRSCARCGTAPWEPKR